MPANPDIVSNFHRIEAVNVPSAIIETSRKITELMRSTFEASEIKLKASPAACTVDDEITLSPHFFDGFVMARFLPKQGFASLTIEDFNQNFNIDLFKVNLASRLQVNSLDHYILVPNNYQRNTNGIYTPNTQLVV